jgi:large subunit ribosomal protein L3
MISGFLVKKGQMTSVYTEDGKRIAVTKCIALPLVVTQIKNQEKDKYQSVQVAYGERRRLNKSISSKLKKLKIKISPKGFQEFSLTSDQIPEIGSDISLDTVFTVGEKIDATGVSKGHGFAGVIKRHGFKKQPIRGSSDRVRHPGSIGAQTPGRVIRGKKMPGHMGNVTKTVSFLKVISIDKDNNEILISGSCPGSFNSWITLKKIA